MERVKYMHIILEFERFLGFLQYAENVKKSIV